MTDTTDPVEAVTHAIEKAEWAAQERYSASALPQRKQYIARAAIAAHLEALEAAGWVVVPAEPTAKMNTLGAKWTMDNMRPQDWLGNGPCANIYRAMIAARPKRDGGE